MKFEKLHVSGFGALQEVAFDDISPGLNVIEGANEAGKTTMLEFVRALFFGFAPRDKSNNDARRYEPTNGGAHGGWGILQNQHGEKWRIERSAGTASAGNCTVEMLGKQGAQNLEGILGYTDRSLYEQVFAFSLEELNDLSRSVEQMEKRVYAASSGYSLLDAIKRTKSTTSGIYLHKGSKPPLNNAIAQYRKLQEAIKQLTGQIEIYNSDRAALLEQKQHAERLTEQVAEADKTFTTAQVHAKAWESWVRLSALREELKHLPEHASFFENAPQQMEEWRAARKQCAEKLQEIQQRLESHHRNLEECVLDDSLLESAPQVTQLKDQLSTYESALRQLPVLQTKLENSRKNIISQLDQLGLQGDEAQLSQIDISLTARQNIQQLNANLESQQSAVKTAMQKEAATADRIAQEQKSLQQLREKVEQDFPQKPFSVEEWEKRQKVLRRAATLLREEADAKTRADFASERLSELQKALRDNDHSNVKVLLSPWASLLFVAAAFVAIILLHATPIPAIIFAIFFLLGAGALFWFFSAQQANVKLSVESDKRRSEQRLEEINRREEELKHHAAHAKEAREHLEKIGQQFGWILNSRVDLDNMTDLLQQNRDTYLRYENALHTIHLRENDLKQLLELQQTQRQELAARKSTFEVQENQWNEWLQNHHLPVGLQTQNAIAFLDHIQNVRRDVSLRDDLQQELQSLETQRVQFQENARLLWEKLQRQMPPENDLPAEVRGLWEALEEQKKLQITREGLLKEQQNLHDDKTVQDGRLHVAEKAIAELLERTASSDENDFDQKTRDAHQRAELQKRCEEERRILETHSAPGDARRELEKQLEQLDAVQVQSNLAVARETYNALHDALLKARETLGGLNNKVRQLEESETQLTSLLRQLEEQKTTIADLTREWAVARITHTLLEHTRMQFEKERQPAVIMRAGELMNGVTGGRYQAVIASDGFDKAEFDRGEMGRLPLSRWSRGTREQFYLALRLAFIENYCSAEHLEPLPVVMDDVLVHADGYQRLAAASAMIADFANQYQVLYFTCRPGDADVLCQAAPTARRFRLEKGRVADVT